MVFVVLGVLLLVLKLLGWSVVDSWSWWWMVLLFGLAVLWWAYADHTGLTRKWAMEKDQARKDERRRRNVEALGLGTRVPRGKTRGKR